SFIVIAFIIALVVNCAGQDGNLLFPGEKHLKNIRQLTFTGENAEAYFSSDGKKLTFQSKHGDLKCDQIFTMNIDGSDMRMVS
ncbi:hypothetical protein OFM36_37130, partial [Escherichia coli]|nr:hypothetical protein [Escherichia coli]